MDNEKKSIRERVTCKFKEIKVKIENCVENFGRFLMDNPQMIAPIASAAGMLVLGGARIAAHNGEKRLDQCRIEDDVTGAEFITKHPLNNDEILELGSRMIDGQWKGDALNEMDLLR